MKIAVMSDTHDNLVAIESALKIINERGIEVVIHCGDIVAPFVLVRFKEVCKGKLYFVFGNNDGERAGLMKMALESGGKIVCLGNQGEVKLAGKKIFVIHESPMAILVAQSSQFDYCFGGHDHRQRKELYGQTLFVNPGNLVVKKAGEFYKSFDHCFSVVDLVTGDVERIDVSDE